MCVRAQQGCRAPLGPSPVPWATFFARSLLNEFIGPDLASLRFLDNAWDLAASPRTVDSPDRCSDFQDRSRRKAAARLLKPICLAPSLLFIKAVA